MSRAVRPPAVAGTFYDADPDRLAAAVDSLLGARAEPDEDSPRPAALVAPHAGYAYSGPVAATAYAHLREHAASYRRVVLLGPAHYVPLRGIAAPAATAFATPLGEMAVDVPACLRLAAEQPTVKVSDAPHREEHALEVQLPFLQRALGGRCTIVPLACGGAGGDDVADVLDSVVDTAQDLVVVSTDLSHYLDHQSACRRDLATAQAVVGLDADAIGSRDACGAVPLRGLLVWAGRHGLAARLLDLRTSGDSAGSHHQVVGYGAFRVG